MTPPPLRGALCGLGVIAWATLLTGDVLPMAPSWCGAGGVSGLALLPQQVEAMLRMTPPQDLLLGAGLMLAAMMVPLVLEPLEQVRRRGGSAMLFLTGYCTLWLPTILLLGLCATLLRLATLDRPMLGLAAAGGVALLWHASPFRARCLRTCRCGPDRGSFRAGTRQALGCIGACAAAMTLPPLFGRAHLAAMAVVTLLLWHERRARVAERAEADCVRETVSPEAAAFLPLMPEDPVQLPNREVSGL